MKDSGKTKAQLVEELESLRARVVELERTEAKHREVEERLRESEERFRVLLEHSSDGINICERLHLDGAEPRKLVFCNERFVEMSGHTREELMACENLNDLVVSAIPEEQSKINSERLRQGLPTRGASSWKRPDGQENYHEWTSVPVVMKSKVYALGIDRDITERRRAERELEERVRQRTEELARANKELRTEIGERERVEAALRESEAKFKQLYELAPTPYHTLTPDGIITDVNRTWCRTLGYRKKEVVGRSIFDFVVPEQSDQARVGFEKKKQSRMPFVVGSERSYRTKTGEAKIFLISDFFLFDKKGDIVSVHTTMEDITQRRHAEVRIRDSEERYRTTLDAMGDMIHVVGPNLRIILFNKALMDWCRGLGYSGDPIAHPLRDVFPYLPQEVFDEYRHVFASGEVLLTERQYRVGGREIILDVRKVPVFTGESVTRVVTVLRDVTEQKRMEHELLKVRKLESLGVLAGGIAHDFNNILMGILGNISLAKAFADPESMVAGRLAEAEAASRRAKDLATQLLTFSKGGAPIKKVAAVGKLAKDAASFSLSGSRSTCEFAVPDDLWSAEIDEGQITQVINNVVINANQAMPTGGAIRIEATNCILDEDSRLPVKKGRYVKISVADEGIGIPDHHLPNIFDPYFTTKQDGDGLGLATAYSIVSNHQGYIDVASELGNGTTVAIYLPASEAKAPSESPAAVPARSTGGHILVMDDEEIVRKTAALMLAQLGYEVETAADGAEAIRMCEEARKGDKPFGVIIMDLTVRGGMGGREAIERLRRRDIEIRAVASSGYSDDPVMTAFKDHGFDAVLAKPYELRELSQAIEAALGETSQ